MEFTVEVETEYSSLLVGHCDLPEKIKKRIWGLVLPRHHQIKVFGKPCQPRRYTQFYSDESEGYGFSNSVAKAQPLPKFLKKLLKYVNDLLNANFNGILVNEYKSGTDYIGSHSDDEKELDPNVGVVAIVLGQTRKFRIRDKERNKIVTDVDIEDSSMVWMKGKFQKEFKHEIPQEKRRNGARRSLTFRYHKPANEGITPRFSHEYSEEQQLVIDFKKKYPNPTKLSYINRIDILDETFDNEDEEVAVINGIVNECGKMMRVEVEVLEDWCGDEIEEICKYMFSDLEYIPEEIRQFKFSTKYDN